MIRLGIADDHTMFADGIANILAERPGLVCCFQLEETSRLTELVEEKQVNLLILDVNVGPENGIALTEKLKARIPDLKIILLSMFQPADIGLNLKSCSADAYILKTSGKEILNRAVDTVLAGGIFYDPNLMAPEEEPDREEGVLPRLTRREFQILSLIAAGKTNKEIAGELFISEHTIKTHRKNIGEKLGSRGMRDLVTKAMKLGVFLKR